MKSIHHICPKCSSENIVKNGYVSDKQRFQCKKCSYQFTRTEPRGRSSYTKAMATILYTMGFSRASIAGFFIVSTQSVYQWTQTLKGGASTQAILTKLVTFQDIPRYLQNILYVTNKTKMKVCIVDRDAPIILILPEKLQNNKKHRKEVLNKLKISDLDEEDLDDIIKSLNI